MKPDAIYATPLDEIVDFKFDDKVASVFPDMIKRSVPGYSTVIATTGVLAKRYFSANSHLYDLGCSLGAATLTMRKALQGQRGKIIAVDNSAAMIERAKVLLAQDPADFPVEFRQADISRLEIENASMVVLNYTLQFIQPEQRQGLIDNIYQGLRPGGILVLSEKIAFEDAHKQPLFTDLHHSFKKTNGYSDLEISQKRQAIDNVLIPETIPQHRARLMQTGFSSADVWFQCFNFASLLAVK
ncbi:MAG: carboxy-S-adenosyl-L-methionine synthase CmoA [Gammaproteobacteria bacterium]|nr:carboxy-S-adenosyl-L-methionine synthase CmoA [Gammaproteobacteria bacterium]MCF6230861.1 carboxy-S-adenosyl-L-methionine synthase CmoA [Gammaproteobacteria bacterium]